MPSGFLSYVMNSWMDSTPHVAILIVVVACVAALAIKLAMAIIGAGQVKKPREWHVEPAFSSGEEITENPWRVEQTSDGAGGTARSLHPQLLRRPTERASRKSI